MSVYTSLTLAQVQHFAQPYGLAITAITPVLGGMENTNYFLDEAEGRQFVLTLFEQLDYAAVTRLVPVYARLYQAHFPIAMPLSYQGQSVHMLSGKPAYIAPRLQGQSPTQPTLKQIQQIASSLARLHITLQHQPFDSLQHHSPLCWQQLAQTVQLDAKQHALYQQVLQRFNPIKQQHPHRVQGLIHADLFRDNTLFVGDELTGILDFSELHRADLLWDIAITLNDFCRDIPNTRLDDTKVAAFIRAYQSIRPLTADEQACLTGYSMMAACCYWLSRLAHQQRNATHASPQQHILKKDPEEMYQLMNAQLQRL